MKKYKLQAVLETTGGIVNIDCKLAEDGVIYGFCKDNLGFTWNKEFFDKGEVWNYLHNILAVKNVIRLVEVIN